MKLATSIRKCPQCAELVHLDNHASVGQCLHCRARTDFSQILTLEQRLCQWCHTGLATMPWPKVKFTTIARTTLLVSVPTVALMLIAGGYLSGGLAYLQPWTTFTLR